MHCCTCCMTLWSSDTIDLFLFADKVNIFYIPVSGFFISYSIFTKIVWQRELLRQGMALRPTQAVGKSNAPQCTCRQPAPNLKLPLGSGSSPDAPAWPKAGMRPLAGRSWTTPTYFCIVKICASHTHLRMQHLGSWVILAANQEVMGCAFLWKHSLSVCCLSVSVESLSLHVPFVLLVFLYASNDSHLAVYEIKRRRK